MQEHWVKIEYTFRMEGIYFELRTQFYLCLINNRYFYYSPNTGKWRLKKVRVWQHSADPEDFIAKAKIYSPPHSSNSSSQSQQKQSNHTKEKKRQSQSNNHSYSSKSNPGSEHRQYSSKDVENIRSEFLDLFDFYLKKQRKRGYRIGWIWYKILEEFIPSKLEICWLSVIFGYSSGWAFHKIRDVHGYAEPSSIAATIKKHQIQWLCYFEQRWGIFEQQEKQQEYKQHKQYQERKQYKQQKTSDSRNKSKGQHSSTASTFAHQAYLQLLGLTLPFTMKELKTAYRRMALQAHPDAGGSAEAFRQVHNAYQTLSVYGVSVN